MTLIKNSTVLVLGACGQVGLKVCERLLEEKPAKIVLCDLKREAVEKGIAHLKKNRKKTTTLVGEWGNIFLREQMKEKMLDEVLESEDGTKKIIEDIFLEIDEERAAKFFLFQIISKHKPDVIIDAINTATALAYQDPYTAVSNRDNDNKWQKLALSMSIPQLVRHTQILFHAMKKVRNKEYVKIGTSGTGGLGVTLPFTHGENEIPSRLLMSKSAVAGAQTMLLWVLARTPGIPRIKEIKVTALIGWRGIGKGKILTKHGPIELYDCKVDNALPIERALRENKATKIGRDLEGAWIDTGENDVFTRDMFVAITAENGMELITPEEIADVVIKEIKGTYTGKEIITALDKATLGPTLVGASKRKVAIDRLKKEGGGDIASIGTLGPLTAKILWEAQILKKMGKIENIIKTNPEKIEKESMEIIKNNRELRAKIISTGTPILLPNGKLVRGPQINIPSQIPPYATIKDIEKWARIGWVDLRAKNWVIWLAWIKEYHQDNSPAPMDIGDLAGWIFSKKLGGLRVKR